MDHIVDFIWRVIKEIIYMIIWGIILYCIGYAVVWAFTLGRYPKGPRSKRRTNLISGLGLFFLIVVWFGIAGYNNFIRAV
jgi:predicted PurR-regulated permease PerM